MPKMTASLRSILKITEIINFRHFRHFKFELICFVSILNRAATRYSDKR